MLRGGALLEHRLALLIVQSKYVKIDLIHAGLTALFHLDSVVQIAGVRLLNGMLCGAFREGQSYAYAILSSDNNQGEVILNNLNAILLRFKDLLKEWNKVRMKEKTKASKA